MFFHGNLYHINPFDGQLFDDVENTVFTLITLNLVVLGLLFVVLKAKRDQMRAQRLTEKRAAKALAEMTETLQGSKLTALDQAEEVIKKHRADLGASSTASVRPAQTNKPQFTPGSGANRSRRSANRRKKK